MLLCIHLHSGGANTWTPSLPPSSLHCQQEPSVASQMQARQQSIMPTTSSRIYSLRNSERAVTWCKLLTSWKRNQHQQDGKGHWRKKLRSRGAIKMGNCLH